MTSPEVRSLLLERWRRSGFPVEMGERLLKKYAEPHRFYHTAEHLRLMFDLLDGSAAFAEAGLSGEDRRVLDLATWYHDREYEPRRKDNELLSAVQFLRDASSLGLDRPTCARVVDLILLTRRHRPPEGDLAAEVLCDMDLAVLGASEADYDRYAGQVRREYGHVAPGLYAWGRKKVLEGFLARPRLYRYLVEREAPARRNLAAEGERLGSAARLGRVRAALYEALSRVAGRVPTSLLRLERGLRRGEVPFPDLPRRLRLWEALSELYLDTEVDPDMVAGGIREAGYGPREAEEALRSEVGPALAGPLPGFPPLLGEWAGFDPDWLSTEILARALRSPGRWERRCMAVLSTWYVRGDFREVVRRLGG